MKLLGKSIGDMNEEEMREWIDKIRAQREALRADAIEKKERGEAIARAPRVPRKREADAEREAIISGFLAAKRQ